MRKIAMLVLAFALLTTAFTGCRAMESESTGTSSSTTKTTASTSTSTAPSTTSSGAVTSSAADDDMPSGTSSITPRGPRMPHF